MKTNDNTPPDPRRALCIEAARAAFQASAMNRVLARGGVSATARASMLDQRADAHAAALAAWRQFNTLSGIDL